MPSYTYEWDFNDGESGSGATVTHKYKGSGNLIAAGHGARKRRLDRAVLVDLRGHRDGAR